MGTIGNNNGIKWLFRTVRSILGRLNILENTSSNGSSGSVVTKSYAKLQGPGTGLQTATVAFTRLDQWTGTVVVESPNGDIDDNLEGEVLRYRGNDPKTFRVTAHVALAATGANAGYRMKLYHFDVTGGSYVEIADTEMNLSGDNASGDVHFGTTEAIITLDRNDLIAIYTSDDSTNNVAAIPSFVQLIWQEL